MPTIPTYEDKITAQGSINAQATPNDFGAQVGAGMERLGAGIESVSDSIYKAQEVKENTDAHVQNAKDQEQWYSYLKEQANSATPGDDSFHERMQTELQDYQAKTSARYTTKSAQQMYARLSSSTMNEFGQMAASIQSKLDAEEARVQNSQLSQALSSQVGENYALRDAKIAEGIAAIDNPKSMYARVPQPVRNEFKRALTLELKTAAAGSYVAQNPFSATESFGAQPGVIEAHAAVAKNNVVPGGTLNISPATMAQAPSIMSAAATKSVNTNVALAQADTPTGTPESIETTVADMAKLLGKYGDYGMALGAYHMGTLKLDQTIAANGFAWQNALPPETANYVSTVLDKAGLTPSDNPTPAAPAQAPAGTQASMRSTSPYLKDLPYEVQQQMLVKGIQLVHFQQGQDDRARAEADRAKTEAQTAATDAHFKKLIDPGQFGRTTLHAISADQNISLQERSFLFNTMTSLQNQAKANADAGNPFLRNQLFVDMHRADDDPRVSYSLEKSRAALVAGRISPHDYQYLEAEYARMKDPVLNPVYRRAFQVKAEMKVALAKNYLFMADEGALAAAADQSSAALDAKIDEYRNAGKNPLSIFDANNKDYPLAPGWDQAYVPSAGVALAKGAGKVVKAGAQDRTPASGFVVGKTYKVNGKDRNYKGGAINLSTSWE